MKKLINLVTGFIAAVAPLFIAGFFGVLIYNELRNAVGILICVLMGGSALWLGVVIFKKIQKMGFLNFITVVHATPDLDNLEPAERDKAKK